MFGAERSYERIKQKRRVTGKFLHGGTTCDGRAAAKAAGAVRVHSPAEIGFLS